MIPVADPQHICNRAAKMKMMKKMILQSVEAMDSGSLNTLIMSFPQHG